MDRHGARLPAILPLSVALVAVVLMALLLFSYFATSKRDKMSLQQTTAQWVAVQGKHEALRFMIATERFFSADPAIDRDALLLRFDILLSRLPLFYSGTEAMELVAVDGLVDDIKKAERDILALEEFVLNAQPGDKTALAAIRSTMEEASKCLREIAFNAVHIYPESFSFRFWDTVLWILYISSAFAGLGLAVLVFMIYAQNRRSEQVAEKYRMALVEADTANRSKSRLLANVSHELRTPLNAIIGFSDVLKDELFGELKNDRYREYARFINESGTHLLTLVSDLLNYAKFDSGEVAVALEPLPLGELIVDSVRMTSPEATKAGVRLVLADIPEDIMVMADQRAVRQIATNLIGNAVKYSPDSTAVEVNCVVGTDRVRIDIMDRGAGIPEQEVPRLLRPFERLNRDSFLADNEAGAGLGLALADALARKHGGSVDLVPRDGGGTRASFSLKITARKRSAGKIANDSLAEGAPSKAGTQG